MRNRPCLELLTGSTSEKPATSEIENRARCEGGIAAVTRWDLKALNLGHPCGHSRSQLKSTCFRLHPPSHSEWILRPVVCSSLSQLRSLGLISMGNDPSLGIRYRRRCGSWRH